MRHATVQPVPCSQTVQHRLLCRNNCGTVTHASRWEFTVTSSAISSVTLLRTGQHVSNSSRCIEMPFGYLVLGMGIWCLYYAWRGIVPPCGAKHEVGKPMRISTRLIFWI